MLKAPAQPSRGAVPERSSDMIYRHLRQDIMSLALPPGTAVCDRDLTLRFGTSRTPVREAQLRLAEEGLLEVVPKSGTVVARIPMASVREATVARQALEDVTVRAATLHAPPSRQLELRANLERQRELAAAGNVEAFHDADNAFHAGIAAAGGYPGIWTMILQLRVHAERYRRLTLPLEGRMDLVVAEHAAVLDAILCGDADGAVAAMQAHLGRLRLDVAVFRDLSPDFFLFD